MRLGKLRKNDYNFIVTEDLIHLKLEELWAGCQVCWLANNGQQRMNEVVHVCRPDMPQRS